MMAWLAERRTFFIWRMVQFWTFLSLLILEIVQLSAYQKDYWAKPANNQVRIWFSEGLSFSLNGYMIFRLNSQWNNSPSKQDILLDWILFVVWGFQSFLNLGPAVSGEGLHCKLGSYEITTLQNQTRCRLFLFSTGLSFFALFTVLVTLTLSILGWRIKRDTKSSSRYGVHNKHHKPQSYLVQKGSFNGEPVLFFYSKNRSVSPYSPYTKDTSVNISIPEPEIVATSKYSRDFTISPLDNDQEEKDDSVLKY